MHSHAFQYKAISIHSLRVEGDVPVVGILQFGLRFQSTPSVWRETSVLVFLRSYAGNFNPLPPCGGRPPRHDPPVITMPFQSTPSVWRETSVLVFLRSYAGNFNPLPPCGGRPPRHDPPVITMPFQSTPSVWRETAKLHSFPLKTQQSKCNFDKKEHRYTSPCQKKYFFSDFFTKKRVRIPPAFFVRLGFAPERFLRTKAVPPHRWFPLRRYVPLLSDTDSPDSRTGGYPSRYRWHPSAAV